MSGSCVLPALAWLLVPRDWGLLGGLNACATAELCIPLDAPLSRV